MMTKLHQIFFMVPPKVQLLDLTGPAQVFYEAIEYGADLSLHFLSMDGASSIDSTAGLSLSDLKPFGDVSPTSDDWIFVPGLDWEIISSGRMVGSFSKFLAWLSIQAYADVNICSVCTGTFLLAESGILKGRNCTTHWKYFSQFRQWYPKVMLLENRLFVKDANVYSSAGVSSGIDLSLFVLERLFGDRFAQEIAREVVIYIRRTELDPQLSVFLDYRNHLDTRIHDAQDFVASRLNTKILISDVAATVSMSERNFTRLFKRVTGITLGKYLEALRIDRAKHMLKDGHKMTFVARECGLKSTNQLRSVLNKENGSHTFSKD